MRVAGNGPLAEHVEGAARLAQPPHAVMDAAWPKSLLRQLEPVALAADEVVDGNAHISIDDLRVVAEAAVRRLGVLHGRHVTHDVDSLGLHGDDEHRGPLVRMDIRIGDCHDDEEIRHGAVGGEPLVAVDDVLVAVPDSRRREQGGIGAGRVGLGHGKGAPEIAVQKGLEPAATLLVVPGGLDADGQQFSVPRIGRVVAEDHGGKRGLTEDLVHESQADLPESHAAEVGRQMCRPKALVLDLLLQGSDDDADLVVRQREGLEREDLLAHEGTHPLELLFEFGLG